MRRLWTILTRRAEPAPEPEEPDPSALPELEPQGWQAHDQTMAGAGFLTMARRLPALVSRALRLAWRASPVTTVSCVGLNLAAGVSTTFGLLATQGVAAALLADGATPERLRAALPSLLVVGGAMAARSVLSMAAGWAQARLRPLVINEVEAEFFAATTAMRLAAFDDAALADDMDKSRQRGTSALTMLVQEAVDLITALAGVAGVASALFVVHPAMLALLAAAAIPTGWAAVRAARAEYVSWKARVSRRRRLWILESLMASRQTAAEVRSLELADWLRGEHRKVVAAETRADFDVLRTQTTVRAIGGAAGGLAGVGVYGALGWLMAIGAVPLSAAATAVLALQNGRSNLGLLIMAVNSLFEQGLYASDHDDFMERARDRVPTSGRRRASGPPQRISLENVSLRYPDADTDAVDGVSFEITRGQTIALVGENGSGKSSLAGVIACLYEPTGGTIRWDGTDVTGFDAADLRGHIAVMRQDYHRWPFTARLNIHIGRTSSSGNGGVEAAARDAGAHDMILEFPRGYETLLDRTFKDGHDLSGGQWQRLTAARSFFRDAPVLICDEPSAALDARAEHVLFEHLRARAGVATTILITHRLANVHHADAIYVLDRGSLVEQGTHAELMALGGRYAELFALQAAGYAV